MPETVEINAQVGNCNCDACKNNLGFQLPLPLLEAACKGDLVIFAGAGVSTENKLAFPVSLYDEIRSELRITDDLPFKTVMAEYCKRTDGRASLLNSIRQRFERTKLWPEIWRAATRFHIELSTIPQIETIITTNWDDFFEVECNAVPFVTDEDFVFWKTAGRKVFKIHGSINNVGSIVATTDDYERCYADLKAGVLGSSLQMLLATKTVVFIGYSLNDAEFVQLFEILSARMGGLRPHSYLVTITPQSAEFCQRLGITPIVTDATFFVQSLKTHLVSKGVLLDESRMIGVRVMGELIESEHMQLRQIDKKFGPAILYTSMFQEGVLSAFSHVLTARSTGTFYDPARVIHLIHKVNDSITEMEALCRYEDVAYLKGQLDAFLFVILSDEDRKHFPRYFVFGIDEAILTRDAFLEDAARAEELHPKAYQRAASIVEKYGGDGLAIHHTPHLYC